MLEHETFKHSFYKCPLILGVWISLSDFIFYKSVKRMAFDIKNVIVGNPDMDHIVNLINIIVKKYIF